MRHPSRKRIGRLIVLSALPLLPIFPAEASAATTRTENFNVDPGWDGHNNRSTLFGPATVTENFGYGSNRVGGTINPTGEAAYFAQTIAGTNLNNTITATGTLRNDGGGNSWIGFFNNSTVNEWRSANSLGLRIYGRGTYFLAYPEYGTSKWRAGADGFVSGGNEVQFPVNTDLNWSLTYNPAGNAGGGSITAIINGQTVIKNLDTGHKADTATFNRFGLGAVNKSYDSPGNVFIDNVNVNSAGAQAFTGSAPGWAGVNNVATYSTNNVRFRFDFGYSNTHNISGGTNGEGGGNFFRGDSRQAQTMAFYGGPLDQLLTLNTPLHANGKLTFKRGVTDSTVHIGFFHNTDSVRVSPSQSISTPEDFVGATIEGPSSEGFYFYPSYGTDAESQGSGGNRGPGTPPYIYPDSTVHNWTLDYDPNGAGGLGQIVVSLDGQQQILALQSGHKTLGAHFNRFGFITPHIDGNGQTVFIDDVTYTVAVGPTTASWAVNASGDWNTSSNWTGGIPTGVDAVANFGTVITASQLVYANTPVTVGTINFNSPNTYLLAGLGTLTMQVSTGSAHVNVQQGTQRINLPLVIASNTDLNIAGGSQLFVSEPVTVAAGKSLTHSGAGTVTYQSTFTLGSGSSVSLTAPAIMQALAMPADAKAEVESSLLIGSGDYQAIRSQVTQGFNGGDWLGDGITSASAANDPSHATALGVVDGADGVLVKYTYLGDADLSGSPDLGDFNRFVSGFDGTSLADWLHGDFDYNGVVDTGDFDSFVLGLANDPKRLVSYEFFSAVSDFASAQGLNIDLTAVPEPASLVSSTLAAGMVLRRRRARVT